MRVAVTRRRKKFAEAKILEVLTPSPLRTEPVCRYFGSCGGCKWQHVQYAAQLEAKRESIESTLRHHAGLVDITVPDVIGADTIYGYRNKMEFSCSASRWLTDWEIATGKEIDKTFALGLHAPGRFDKVLDIDSCHLVNESDVAILNGIRKLALEQDWQPWHVRNHTGFLRHVVIRIGHHTGDRMVNVVTSHASEEKMEELTSLLKKHHAEVTTLVNTINSGPAQTAIGERTDTIFGSGFITEKMGPYTFEIGPNTFFQTNTVQAERLYEVAIDFAELTKDDHVYDLYCGCGTISLYAAALAGRVTGVELVPEAVDAAVRNARSNGVENCAFVSGDMLTTFTDEFIENRGHPDVIILDPPRAGLHPKIVRRLGRSGVSRIVYVSCNPMSQAKDLEVLTERYNVDRIQPVDMFPHTHHIENVIRLTLKS